MSDTPAAGRPKTLRKDVSLACQLATVIALGTSIELNVYAHVHGHVAAFIGVSIGIVIPLLVAILSHVAAHVNFHVSVQVWIGVIVTLLMYVSATSGIRVLAPGLGYAPAVIASVTIDLAALTALGTSMYNASQKAALARWEARQEEQRQQAEREELERARQAEYEALAARFGRAGNGRGNALGNSRGNAVGGSGGNAPAVQPGNGGWPALPPAAPAGVVASTAETVPGGPPTEPLATVTDLPRRPSMSDDEMWSLAMKLAAEREQVGLELTVRAFMDEYGGTPKRVAPLVKKVKEARAAGQGEAAE